MAVSPPAGNIAQGSSLSCLRFITLGAFKCYNSTIFLQERKMSTGRMNTDDMQLNSHILEI